jgi:hypothetical protein
MTQQIKHNTLNEATFNNLTSAMFSESFPGNPIPFAQGLANYVKDNGTDSIKTDEAKQILWVLMAQSYGELTTVDLCEEWGRLHDVVAAEEGFGER